MSHRHFAPLKHAWGRTLLIATLPLACAVGVKPEFDDTGDDGSGPGTAGMASGGKLGFAGSASAGTPAKAGSSATSGGSGSAGAVASPFGGTASSGGKGGSSGSAGSAGASGAAGAGGNGGAAGAAGTAGAAGAGGAGTGTCACPMKLTWADNTNLSWGPGACLDVGGTIYLYTGAKAQTWANKDCNPTMQLAWCSDVGADYKFMLCK